MSTEQPENQLTPSTALEYKQLIDKRKLPKVIELPSGMRVSVIRPSISALLRNGKVPASLISAATIQQSKGSLSMDKKQISESMLMIDMVVSESVVQPKFVMENPKDDELLVSDLLDEDKNFIWNYVQTGATALEGFRPKE